MFISLLTRSKQCAGAFEVTRGLAGIAAASCTKFSVPEWAQQACHEPFCSAQRLLRIPEWQMNCMSRSNADLRSAGI